VSGQLLKRKMFSLKNCKICAALLFIKQFWPHPNLPSETVPAPLPHDHTIYIKIYILEGKFFFSILHTSAYNSFPHKLSLDTPLATVCMTALYASSLL